MIILAEMLNKNEFDPRFLGQFIQIVILIGGLAAIWRSSQRKPPVGEDLSRITAAIAAIRDDFDDAKKRFAAGDRVLVELQKGQAVNSEAIQNIKSDVHEMKTNQHTLMARILQRPAR